MLDSFLPNYYTIGAFIATLFLSFMALIIYRIKEPSKASRQLVYVMVTMTIFHASYIITHGLYDFPLIYTRWMNNFIALLGATHCSQFLFHFPNTRNETFAKNLLRTQYTIAILAGIYLFFVFSNSPFYYLFNSHFWDSESLNEQKYVGLIIFLYFSLIGVVGFWRAKKESGHDRKITIYMVLAFLIITIFPGVLHVLSRDGLMERSHYMTATVFFNLVGFFIAIIVFINNTRDRTTILARLIGISIVTLLLILQFVSYFWMANVEDSFDQVHISIAKEKFLENKKHPSQTYRIVYNINTDTVNRGKENLDSINPDEQIQILKNTSYYYRFSNTNQDNFIPEVNSILAGSNKYFSGYKGFLEKVIQEKNIQNSEELTEAIQSISNRVRYLNSKLRAIDEEKWAKERPGFLKSIASGIPGFLENIKKDLSIDESTLTKSDIKFFLLPLHRPEIRSYSGFLHSDGKTIPKHHVTYQTIIPYEGATLLVETGFDYKYYREQISSPGWIIIGLILASYIFVLLGFKVFFGGALLQPIQNLVDGLTEVNEGNLDVNLPIKVEDEIGFMTRSFNNMTWSIKSSRLKLQEYAEQLEQKVEERTKELTKTLEEVQELKHQQDGDYFLTTLLLEPLGYSEINSPHFSLESYVKQKKQFTFRKWSNNIGGDINIAQQITLNGKSHIVFVNADAMGKSMQGAGGALVLGSVFHTILDRTEMDPTMQMIYPERWLKNLFIELHKVFESFNGSMLISGFFGVLDEESGFLYYLNCEHPKGVLYRDGKASFFEKDVVLRKLGTSNTEGSLRIETFQMELGDAIILGSDGRDDILTGIDETGARIINEDETLFLEVAEECKGNIPEIVEKLDSMGELTDDLSLIKIERFISQQDPSQNKREGIAQVIQSANQYIEEDNLDSAIAILLEYVDTHPISPEIIRALSRLYYQVHNYEFAAKYAQDYMFMRPSDHEFLYFASLCFRRIKDYHKSIDLSERLRLRNFNFSKNLGLLADLHLKMGNKDRALAIYRELEEIDEDGNVTQYLREKLDLQ
jgi:HAMP domain-containing protein